MIAFEHLYIFAKSLICVIAILPSTLLRGILFFGLDFPCDRPKLELIVTILTLNFFLKIAN
jgi:hypothetical protein